ncbi:MAG TPA: S1 RNA-binding domain-containing protein [Spirochaetota bacterium]|jgi:small subunit ribosomal protein S1|nr:S1 RNA-binding domain-containing protein [Spirochaetota bacterium]HOK01807.1 S1 RNA-binding domain-containing protein [Spirochaetota bacterium]HOK91998.1 S1 RNA-binding domain-containing protein [Spirochaetota bacterium]HON15407.1 S1 RNA-binding domain-containing protein [Spirochaetota bacterium]HPP94576.1 S1 RNA-binding domain-containing protein [Spirochaetota bacterium]
MAELNNDFAKMFEESLKTRDDYAPGDKIEGKVVFIGKESSFIGLSGKTEAIIDTAELMDEKGNFIYQKGDIITAYIVSVRGGEVKVTTKLGAGEINLDLLHLAYQNSIEVEGTVAEEVKGGFSVNISGIRCFCPYSQIDLKSSDDKSQYIGKSFSFRIIEFKENGKNILLSRRILLEEEQKEKEKNLRKSIAVGDIVNCKVASIQNFGLFVDLGGMEGLVPKSELSWGRDASVEKFSVGQNVRCKILTADWDNKKITLSIKQVEEEPWMKINFSEGDIFNAKIVNIIPQGAFAELTEGVEGFIHISKMSLTKKIRRPEEILKKGDLVNVRLLSIDKEKKKISLELITDEADPWAMPIDALIDSTQTGIIENTKSTGVSVRLQNGMLGFIPKGELKSQNDIAKNYATGKEIKVLVKEIDKENKKLILSETGALKKEEESVYKNFINSNNSSSGATLGNLFKDKFDNIKNQVREK